MRKIGTVVFDWDGTLCDSGSGGLRAFEKMFADFGITITHAQYRSLYSPDWYSMYRALGLPNPLWPKADERWVHYYRDEQPDLMQGASHLLDYLRESGVRLGIVTSGSRDRVERELARFGLSTSFEALICYEDVFNKKPHPEGLEKALVLLDCSPENCCYVGDTPADILMGKAARAYTIGVLSDYVDRQRLEEAAPDLLLKGLNEIPDLLFAFGENEQRRTAP
jgi:HAD superfamily hydrolase (TIGR01509 family)